MFEKKENKSARMISGNDLALVTLLDLDIFKYIARITYLAFTMCVIGNWPILYGMHLFC